MTVIVPDDGRNCAKHMTKSMSTIKRIRLLLPPCNPITRFRIAVSRLVLPNASQMIYMPAMRIKFFMAKPEKAFSMGMMPVITSSMQQVIVVRPKGHLFRQKLAIMKTNKPTTIYSSMNPPPNVNTCIKSSCDVEMYDWFLIDCRDRKIKRVPYPTFHGSNLTYLSLVL